MINQSTVDILRKLHCSAMADELTRQLEDAPTYNTLGFEERLALLTDAEWNRRQANKLKRYISQATLSIPGACIEGIEYLPDRKLDKAQILRFATCQYINDNHHIILKGATGSGKTYLACAFGNAACRKFKSVRYIRMPELLDELSVAQATGTFRKTIKAYQKVDLLILDEWLIRCLTSQETYNLLEIVEARVNSSKGSMIFCTQYTNEEWYARIDPESAEGIERRSSVLDYIRKEADGQLAFTQSTDFLKIPSCLYGFHNETTSVKTSKSGRSVFCFEGSLNASEENLLCSCGSKMHVNNHPSINLRHLPFGSSLSCVTFSRNQYVCPKCGSTRMQFISFKAPGHMITEELYQYTRDLLASGVYTNKEVAEITGLGKNTVKDIDKERLQELYTTTDGRLIKPEKPAKFLGIDEFKLHNGYRYATHIIDMETGHILWIAGGKKKQVVYDFIEHVGLKWMDQVEAVACDMNSDFQEAFEEKCPHIQPVFDFFHIVKNFNDKVVSEVRKDEQRRLYEEGNVEAARALKKTRYILMSSRETLQSKDADAREERQIHKGSSLFKTDSIVRKEGYEARYDALLQENQLLFTLDLIKEKLSIAYTRKDEAVMAEDIISIMDMCKATGNPHFLWFERLLSNHFEGIIAHATYDISAAKIEGINNKIKTLRRQGYGYPDDEYFFLKLFDMSRRSYERNPKSHKICD